MLYREKCYIFDKGTIAFTKQDICMDNHTRITIKESKDLPRMERLLYNMSNFNTIKFGEAGINSAKGKKEILNFKLRLMF